MSLYYARKRDRVKCNGDGWRKSEDGGGFYGIYRLVYVRGDVCRSVWNYSNLSVRGAEVEEADLSYAGMRGFGCEVRDVA